MDATTVSQPSLTLATWLWLLVPMLSCVVLSVVTYAGAALKRH